MGFIGDKDDDDTRRFKFEMKGNNELIILGINPSTARANICKDPTINRAIEFSDVNWNYNKETIEFDGFLMLNICAQSTSKPDELSQKCDINLHQKNLEKIGNYLEEKKTKGKDIYILLAYGNAISKRDYLKSNLKEIIDVFKNCNATFFKMGENMTKENNPRHIKPQNPKLLPITAPLTEISDSEFKAIYRKLNFS